MQAFFHLFYICSRIHLKDSKLITIDYYNSPISTKEDFMEIDKSWMTTFIYEQDLRSYYMNNILYSLLHTGVYNADISISSNNGILFLNIKKGTTLVFSNDYVDIKKEVEEADNTLVSNPTSTIIGRSFNGKSKVSYGNKGESKVSLIKCVALEDMVLRLNYLGASNSLNASTEDLHICANGFNKSVYIYAVIRYSADGTSDSFIKPEFRLLVNNDSYSSNYKEEAPVESRYFYKFMPHTKGTVGKLEVDDGNPPDGVDSESLSTSARMVNWLMLGVINPIDREWSSSSEYSFDGNWYKNHVFTGRGLPEYRYPLSLGREILSPEIMFDTPCMRKEKDRFINDHNIGYKKIYLDADRIINNGRVYSSTIDWRQFYSVGPFRHISEIKNNTDSETQKLNPKLVELSFPSIKKYIESEIKDSIEEFVIYDVVFACSRNNITNSNGTLSERKLNLISYRGYTDEGNVCQYFDKNLYEVDSQSRELYLDISSHNVDNLIGVVTNRDFLSIAIEGLRRDGKLDPNSNGESLIPVCIIFRPFYKDAKGKVKPIGIPEVPEGEEEDKYKYIDCINPVNVLSYFDIAYKMTELNPITVKAQDAFTVIPVMN